MLRRDFAIISGRRAGGVSRAFGLAATAFVLIPTTARAAGAIEIIAQETAQSLKQSTASTLVVAAPLATDVQSPKGDELALRVAALLAGRIGASARAFPQTSPLAAARATAGRASALVYVQTEISKGDLRATVDVYPTVANAWDRVRNPVGAPIGHAFASAKIDAEVRSFLLPLVLEQATLHRARHEEQDVLAAACGDVDGDGGDEIVLASRERVALGRVHNGRFVVERAASWSELSPRSAVPMREPLAGAVIALGTIAVGSTDRGALWLTRDLVAGAPIFGVPASAADGVVCLVPQPSAGAFDGAPVDCAVARDAKPIMAVPAPRFDAFASGAFADAQGNIRPFVAVREPSGKLKLKSGDGPSQAPDGTFGPQVAMGDFDQDGAPEIATSAEGPEDAVDLWSWPSEGSAMRARLHLSAPAGVRALAVCPPEEGGEPVLVAVVGSEVWLVRAGVSDAGPPPRPRSAAGAGGTGP